MRRLHFCGILVCCFLVAAPSVFAQEEDELIRRMRVLEDILREAQRQETVSRRMAGVIEEFYQLVGDLRSNKVMREGKGEELAGIAGSVEIVNEENVLPAADHLQRAGRNYETRRPHLNAADAEIQAALRELTILLRKANALRFEEFIVAKLEETIRAQEKTNSDTRTLGREILQGTRELALPPAELAEQQKDVAASVRELGKLIQEALRDEATEESVKKLVTAAALITKHQIESRLENAALNIEQKNLIVATGQQKRAMEALRLVETTLKADRSEELRKLMEARDKLKRLLEQQRRLRERIEASDKQKFEKEAKDHQVQQHELKKQVGKVDEMLDKKPAAKILDPEQLASALRDLEKQQDDLAKQSEQSSPENKQQNEQIDKQQKQLRQRANNLAMVMPDEMMKKHTEDAMESMRQAEDQLQKNKPQEAAPKQKDARDSLAKAREQAQQLAKQQKEQKEALSEAQNEMSKAEKSLQQKKQDETTEAQERAEEQLNKALKKLDEKIARKEFGRIPDKLAKQIAEMRRAVEKIRELLQEQIRVRRRTEGREERKENVRPLAEPQQKLARRAQDFTTSLPDELSREPLEGAHQAMSKAVQNLNQNQPPPAIKQQKEAEKKLNEALAAAREQLSDLVREAERKARLAKVNKLIDDLKRLIKQQEALNKETERAAEQKQNLKPQAQKQQGLLDNLNEIRPSSMSSGMMVQIMLSCTEAASAMKGAVAELEQNHAVPGMEEQKRALAALREALRGAKEQKQKDSAKGKKKGKGKKKAEWKKSKKGKQRRPSQERERDRQGMRRFSESRFLGDEVEGGESTWESLGKRERDALRENFARELPREYRELLKAYYESLSETSETE